VALEVLVAAGADVNAAGGKYGSALQMAAKSGNMEAVRWLLAHGADVEARAGKYGGVREAALAKEQWNVLSYLWRLCGK
jgi:ankyrin repeat protein